MAERQEHQALFDVVRRKQVVGVAHLVGDAAVGMHRALRRTRGAGGVDQDGEIVGAAACDHLVPQRCMVVDVIAPERHEFGERHHHRIDEAGEAFHVEHDDLLQGRAARPARQDLVELLLVLGEDHLGRGIVDQIFDLDRGIGRIDAGGNAAGAQDAHIGIHPFRHGVGDDRGDVARPEADGVQAVGDFLRYLLPLPPAGGLPDAELLLADRRLVAARFHRQQKALRDRVRHSQHCGIWPYFVPSASRPRLRMPALTASLFRRQTRTLVILAPSSCVVQRHVFFFFQRRSPRAPSSLAPR